MKSTLSGLVAAIIIGAIGLILLRSAGILNLPNLAPSPSPSASIEPNFELNPSASLSPSPAPSGSPLPSTSPTTKGGVVLGEVTPQATARPTTTKTVTTQIIKHSTFTLAKVSKCPSSVVSELKDISSSLSVQYQIKDGFSAAITVWGDNGVELSGQKLYTGNGKITDTGSNKYLKVLIQPHSCPAAEDNWMTVTASR